jgi:hypothetical protein
LKFILLCTLYSGFYLFKQKKFFYKAINNLTIIKIKFIIKMHLTPVQRMRVVTIYSRLPQNRSINRYKLTKQKAAKQFIFVSEKGIYKVIKKWKHHSNFFRLFFLLKLDFKLFFYKDEVGDRESSNEHKRFISDEGFLAINKSLLRNPFQTRTKLKRDLNLIAKPRTISDAIRRLGWRKVPTRYCQIVEPRNCLKRFIYCCLFCKK